MKKLKVIFVLVLFPLVSLGHLHAQTKVFSSTKGSGKNQAYYEFDKWNFLIGEDKYEIDKNGMGKRTSAAGVLTRFRLISADEGVLHRVVYFSAYKNDLIVLSEIDAGDSGAGFCPIIKIAKSSRTAEVSTV